MTWFLVVCGGIIAVCALVLLFWYLPLIWLNYAAAGWYRTAPLDQPEPWWIRALKKVNP